MPTLPNDTTELVPAGALNTTPRQDYYTALRDYVKSLSSPYGMYIPEVSELLRYNAGSPTGRMGSGAYDVMASNPYAALANPDAPIDPSLLAAITSSVNPNAPYEQNVTYQFNPYKEGKYASSNAVDVLYNTPIRLTDINGNVIMSGVGFQAAEQIAKAVQDAYGSGAKSEFRIDTGMPGDTSGTGYKTASIVSPEQNGLAQFIGTALPIVTSFIPGLNVLGKIASMAAAGGAGAAIQGKDPLKGALLAGATAGLVNAPILPGGASIGSTLGNVLGTSAAQGGLDAVTGEIVVPGIANAVGSGFGQLGAGAITNAVLGSNISNYQQALNDQYAAMQAEGALPSPEPVDPNQIVAVGNTGAAGGLNMASAISPAVAQLGLDIATNPAKYEQEIKDAQEEQAKQDEDGILVEHAKLAPVTVDNIFSGLSGPVINGVDTATGEIVAKGVQQPKTDATANTATGALTTLASAADTSPDVNPEDDIVAEGKKTPDSITPPVDLGKEFGPGTTFEQPTLSQPDPTTLDQKSPLDKAIDYLKAAGLGVGLLDSVLGKGGSGTLGKMPGGFGSGSGVYSATLPTPGQNGAFAVGGLDRGTGAGGIGGVTPPGGDYTRFGMGSATRAAPSNIPQYGGVNPPGFNTQTWEWLGPQTGVPKDITDQLAALPSSATPAEPVKKAMGGYAVGGPGDGRSDEIPAMLSDGEYVIDAETVALLGNGSNKAGAQQLDKFRANIRKHKGRELARGQFSVKAKAPDAYLPKGRS